MRLIISRICSFVLLLSTAFVLLSLLVQTDYTLSQWYEQVKGDELHLSAQLGQVAHVSNMTDFDQNNHSVEHHQPVMDVYLYAQKRTDARLGNHIWLYASVLGVYYMTLQRHNKSSPKRINLHLVQRGFETLGIFEGEFPPSPPWESDEGQHILELQEDGYYGKYTDLDVAKYASACHERQQPSMLPSQSLCIVEISGFRQSHRYFQDTEEEIRRHLKFHSRILEEVNYAWDSFLETTGIAESSAIVGIHHRGSHGTKYMVTPPIQYYERAMERFQRQYPRGVNFIVACDSKKRCERFFQKSSSIQNLHILPTLTAKTELALLATKSRDGFIMSTGTYGWWAGWLSGSEVIYYRDGLDISIPPNDDGHLILDDYYPNRWTPLANRDWEDG